MESAHPIQREYEVWGKHRKDPSFPGVSEIVSEIQHLNWSSKLSSKNSYICRTSLKIWSTSRSILLKCKLHKKQNLSILLTTAFLTYPWNTNSITDFDSHIPPHFGEKEEEMKSRERK